MLELKKGDAFATRNPMLLGRMINFTQKIWSKDSKSEYSHVGIIVDPCGETFEALWTISRNCIYTKYTGQQVVIFRNKGMTDETFSKGMEAVSYLEGKPYPGWRLPLFLIPPLAKLSIFKLTVCSELFRMFCRGTGLSHIRQVFGWNPDDCVDYCRNSSNWEIVFEGILNKEAS